MSGSILILEDEPSIVDALEVALKREGFSTNSISTVRDGLVALRSTAYDLLILDIGLPDGDGFEVCKEVRRTSTLPILFLTARDNEIDKVLGLELGGDDYIPKPFSPRELVARVKAILRRTKEPHQVSPIKRVGPFQLDDARKVISFYQQDLDLSRYEYKILELLLRRPGRVYSREQLMSLIWEEPDMSLERTIDTHIKTLRAKLRKIKAEDALITHRGFGYSLKDYI